MPGIVVGLAMFAQPKPSSNYFSEVSAAIVTILFIGSELALLQDAGDNASRQVLACTATAKAELLAPFIYAIEALWNFLGLLYRNGEKPFQEFLGF
jgi:hypothetical protein